MYIKVYAPMKILKGFRKKVPNTNITTNTIINPKLTPVSEVLDLFEMSYLPLCMFAFYIEAIEDDEDVIHEEFRKNFLANSRK